MDVREPLRVKHTYRQKLKAPPDTVFPLLCPVREREWVSGWNPLVVHSFSGHAERDCVFVTLDGESEAIWVVIDFDPQNRRIEFVKVTPGITVGRVSIALQSDGYGGTLADVTYMYTALSERGYSFVKQFTEEAYLVFMRRWEEALNHYLLTGKKRED